MVNHQLNVEPYREDDAEIVTEPGTSTVASNYSYNLSDFDYVEHITQRKIDNYEYDSGYGLGSILYILDEDCTVSSHYFQFGYDYAQNCTHTLDLNGHRLYKIDSYIYFDYMGAVLNICDTSAAGTGYLSHMDSVRRYDDDDPAYRKLTLNFYGGTIGEVMLIGRSYYQYDINLYGGTVCDLYVSTGGDCYELNIYGGILKSFDNNYSSFSRANYVIYDEYHQQYMGEAEEFVTHNGHEYAVIDVSMGSSVAADNWARMKAFCQHNNYQYVKFRQALGYRWDRAMVWDYISGGIIYDLCGSDMNFQSLSVTTGEFFLVSDYSGSLSASEKIDLNVRSCVIVPGNNSASMIIQAPTVSLINCNGITLPCDLATAVNGSQPVQINCTTLNYNGSKFPL